jgi:hypothetical protein
VVQSPHRPIPRSGYHVGWGRALFYLAFRNEPIGAYLNGAVTRTAGGHHSRSQVCTPQSVVTYTPSVHTASAQDITNYALTLALSLLNATLNDAQMLCSATEKAVAISEVIACKHG